jgi:hypothetical protein
MTYACLQDARALQVIPEQQRFNSKGISHWDPFEPGMFVVRVPVSHRGSKMPGLGGYQGHLWLAWLIGLRATVMMVPHKQVHGGWCHL